MYSPYHVWIMHRIKNGELIGYDFAEDYPKFGPALLLHFSTFPFVCAIKPYKWAYYAEILDDLFPNECSYEKK